jgi:hypothetical protein
MGIYSEIFIEISKKNVDKPIKILAKKTNNVHILDS